jgi:UDP-N-acetylmuramoylalanine--D-glutamate ligase
MDAEPETKFVVEISSFQAARLKYLPMDGLLWTTFSENHLDYHRELDCYFLAKWSLIDRLVNPLFAMGQSVFEYARDSGRQLPEFALVVPNAPGSPDDALPAGTIFERAPFDEDFRLCAAFGETIGIPRIVWHQTAQSFQPPKYRMTRVAEIGGIGFYNDAKSGNFASTLAGLRRFDEPVLWIGSSPHSSAASVSDAASQNGDLPGFIKAVAPKLKAAYLAGELGGVMASLLRRVGATASACETLEDAVTMAFEEAQRGDVIVFSPAFPPKSPHESFAARGNFFEKIVLELQNREKRKAGAKV